MHKHGVHHRWEWKLSEASETGDSRMAGNGINFSSKEKINLKNQMKGRAEEELNRTGFGTILFILPCPL